MTKRKRYDGELKHLRGLEDKIENSGVGREIKASLEALTADGEKALREKLKEQEEGFKRSVEAFKGWEGHWKRKIRGLKDEVESLKADNDAELEVSEALREKLKKAKDELTTYKKAVEAQKERIKELVIRAQKAEKGGTSYWDYDSSGF